MQGLFRISAEDVKQLESRDFSGFVNSLLRAELGRMGISPDRLLTTDNTTAHDGGIDAYVDATGAASASQWIPAQQCVFQFKSGEQIKPSRLMEEIQKPEVQAVLQNGGLYIVAVTKDLTPNVQKRWLNELRQQLQQSGLSPDQVRLYAATRLAEWASEHLSLILLVRGHLFGDLLRHDDWKLHIDKQEYTFVADPLREECIQNIRDLVCGKHSFNHLRIVGYRGVGKTRLVWEALKETGIAERVAYASSPEAIRPGFWNWLRSNPNRGGILVVDECDDKDALEGELRSCKGDVYLITIGHGTTYEHSPPHTIFLQKLETDLVREALRQAYPTLTREQAEWIARLSEGYIKLAFLCALEVQKDPSITTYRLAQAIEKVLQKLIPDQNTRKALRAVALTNYCGVEGDVRWQGEMLAEFVGISCGDFCDALGEGEKQGIIQKAGRYRAITPDLLASWLAGELWRTRREDLEQLIQHIREKDEDFALGLYDRLVRLGAFEETRAVIRDLLSPEGFFRSLSDLKDKWKAKIFYKLALAAPEDALRLLERFLRGQTPEQLRNFVEGRRTVVSVLEYLKWFRELFPRAGRLLLALAEAENETWANNATGVWKQMFKINFGATETPAIERLTLIQEALESPSKTRRLLALEALSSVLSLPSVGAPRSVPRAGQPLPKEWHPQTLSEVQECLTEAIKLLDRALNDSDTDTAQRAFEVFCEGAYGLAFYGLVNEVIARTERFVHSKSARQRKMLRDSLERILFHFGEQLQPLQRERLIQLQKRLLGESFTERLYRWVGEHAWSDGFTGEDEGTPDPDEEIRKLAEEAFQNPELLRNHLDWLFSEEATHKGHFALFLGHLDTERAWFAELLSFVEQGCDHSFLMFYLLGRYESGDSEWCEDLFDQWATENPEYADIIFGVTSQVEPTDRNVNRALQLFRSKRLDITYLVQVARTPWSRDMEQSLFVKVLETLLTEITPVTVEGLLAALANRLEHQPKELDTLSELIWRVLAATTKVPLSPVGDYYWTKIASKVVDEHPERVIQLFVEFYRDSSRYPRFSDKLKVLFKHALQLRPKQGWQVLSSFLLNESEHRAFLLDSLQDLSDALDPTIVLEWADKHGQFGKHVATWIARVDESVPLNDFARQLLAKYPDDENVWQRLYMRYTNGFYQGNLSDNFARKLDVAKQWQNDEHPAVRNWAAQVVEWLERDIERFRQEEEEWRMQYE